MICVYDEHPIARQDIKYQAPDSRSGCTRPFDDIIMQCVTCETILNPNDHV